MAVTGCSFKYTATEGPCNDWLLLPPSEIPRINKLAWPGRRDANELTATETNLEVVDVENIQVPLYQALILLAQTVTILCAFEQ